MKVVINTCYGNFCLSEAAYKFLGLEWDNHGYEYSEYDDRTNPKLVECVETLGKAANGAFADLKVVEVPDDVEWDIENYDGVEWVSEAHRTWK